MKTSEEGIKLIKHFEGIKNRPYKCSARVWTIGVGHVIYDAQLRLKLAERDSFKLKPEDDRIWSNEEIDDLLKRDLHASSWEYFVCWVLCNQDKVSLMLLSALALILVWGHFKDRQFGQHLYVVIKRVLVRRY
jgi:hypothetical protein